MIDTDKYEGHTEGPWCVIIDDGMHITPDEDNSRRIAKKIPKEADADLIADAPLLLAEVKDLQKKLDNLREYCHAEGYDIFNWEVKNIEVIE
jgi:hypothetical protein